MNKKSVAEITGVLSVYAFIFACVITCCKYKYYPEEKTIVLRDTIYERVPIYFDMDAKTMNDTIKSAKRRLRILNECIRCIDPYEETTDQLVKDINNVRKAVDKLKNTLGDNKKLGRLHEKEL